MWQDIAKNFSPGMPSKYSGGQPTDAFSDLRTYVRFRIDPADQPQHSEGIRITVHESFLPRANGVIE
jgi:hypothetical protein